MDTDMSSNMPGDLASKSFTGNPNNRYNYARAQKMWRLDNIFKNLSMTNEEKILRKTYGANYESSVKLMKTSQLSATRFSPLRKRSPGTSMGKRVVMMEDPYHSMTPGLTRNHY